MNEHIVMGKRDEWGKETTFSLSSADRRHHVYVVGKSGTGKTTLLRNMILQDIEAGRGVGLIDPHGDLALDILDHIPRHRAEDVAYFDPSDAEYPVGFNLLGRVPPQKRHLVASGNLKAAVLQADWFDPELNPKLRAFCEHYGTALLPTKPAMPRHKGKI